MSKRASGLLLMLVLHCAFAQAQAPEHPLQEAYWVQHDAKPAARKTTNAVAKVAKPQTQQNTFAKMMQAEAARPVRKDVAFQPPVAAPSLSSLPMLNAKGLSNPGNDGSTPWAIVVGLTLLTLLPAILLAMTPMVRLLVVFHFLRQALGTQTAPSNQVLMGLALMMTWFLMQSVLVQVDQQALTPYQRGNITLSEALDRGSQPVKQYMLHYTREKDLDVFVAASHTPRPAKPSDLGMQIVVPSYILSELKAGFQIGAILFLPFLLIDFLVASITTSIGMLQLSPMVISTPVKILLFVMVDGWSLLADQMIKSF